MGKGKRSEEREDEETPSGREGGNAEGGVRGGRVGVGGRVGNKITQYADWRDEAQREMGKEGGRKA